MEAKDTMFDVEVEVNGVKTTLPMNVETALNESFKAGIREVVDDLTMAIACSTKANEQAESACEVLKKWEAKLKEEGSQ